MENQENTNETVHDILENFKGLNYDSLIRDIDYILSNIKAKLSTQQLYEDKTRNIQKLEVDRLNTIIRQKNHKIAELQNHLETIHKTNENLQKEIADLKQNDRDLENKINEKESEINDTKQIIVKIENENNSLKSEISNFKQKLDENSDEVSKIKLDLENKEKNLSYKELEISDLKSSFIYKKYTDIINELDLDFFTENNLEKKVSFNSLKDEYEYDKIFIYFSDKLAKQIYSKIISMSNINLENYRKILEPDFELINPIKNDSFKNEYHEKINILTDDSVESEKIISTKTVGLKHKNNIYKAQVVTAS